MFVVNGSSVQVALCQLPACTRVKGATNIYRASTGLRVTVCPSGSVEHRESQMVTLGSPRPLRHGTLSKSAGLSGGVMGW